MVYVAAGLRSLKATERPQRRTEYKDMRVVLHEPAHATHVNTAAELAREALESRSARTAAGTRGEGALLKHIPRHVVWVGKIPLVLTTVRSVPVPPTATDVVGVEISEEVALIAGGGEGFEVR